MSRGEPGAGRSTARRISASGPGSRRRSAHAGIGIDIDRLADPAFLAQGRLEAHSDHRWFASAAGAASGRSPLGVSPDGVWEFAYAKNPAPAVDGFQDPDYDVSQWDGIPVPAHIQFRGYDLPQYVNVQHPWDGHEQIDPGRVPQDYNPVGLLRARLHPARTPARRRADRVQGQPPRVRRPGRVMTRERTEADLTAGWRSAPGGWRPRPRPGRPRRTPACPAWRTRRARPGS